MAAVNRLEGHGLDIRILPPLADIASGRHLVNLVREVEITDLLGREPVAPVKDLLSRCIENKTVLVTGAGGSIGSALSRTVARLSPKKLILLDASEPALYQIDRKLRDEIPEVEVVAAIGSVRDKSLVRKLIRDHGIETIYHAAAHKHVPLVESNIAEAVHNNILGTRNMVELALVENVETFVLVSTDKAVRPTNVMGATKRWAELVVQDADARARKAAKGQRFSAVRFGNVLGSSGSVIPLFKEQIARGGPVTVTHPEVTRYFMSVEEAVALIIQAGSMASGGEVFLLEMGEPVRIQDLARKMIEVSGHRVKDEANPNGDIEISIAGLRPGEKLYEELLVSGDGIEQTDHPRIMRSREPSTSSAKLKDLLAAVDRDLESDDSAAARALLLEIANSNLQPESKAQQSADI
jgi:FlaA1/EpsC-like NDP-sugar epimerase